MLSVISQGQGIRPACQLQFKGRNTCNIYPTLTLAITGHNMQPCWKCFRQNHLVHWHSSLGEEEEYPRAEERVIFSIHECIATKRRALFKNVSNIPPLSMKVNSSFTLPNPALVPALTSRCCFFTFRCLLRDFPHAKRMAEGAAEVILSSIPPSHPTFWYSDLTLAPQGRLYAY